MERDRFLQTWRAHAKAHGAGDARAGPVDRTRLDALDITGEMRRRVAVVSLGNACEAHGPALAPDIDDRTGAVVGARVAAASGARYLGHAPYATDGIGDVAGHWSPEYLAPEVFVDRLAGFVDLLLEHFYRGAPRPDLVVFLSGHGGNGALAEHLGALAGRISVDACRYALAFAAPPADSPLNPQHAADGEHAVAAALGPGAFSRGALEAQNAALETDEGLVRTVLEHPALGGMAGFYIFGGSEFDGVRARYPDVKSSVQAIMQHRRVEADASAGQAWLDHSVEVLAMWVVEEARAMGIAGPKG